MQAMLLEFAKKQNWKRKEDLDLLFGDSGGHTFSLAADGRILSLFVPVAGIAAEELEGLGSWLESERFSLRLTSYDFAENFLAVKARLPHTGGVKKIADFVEQLTARLDQAQVPADACVICGEAADRKAIVMGLYAPIHEPCLDREGVDFTGRKTAGASTAPDFLPLDETPGVDRAERIRRLAQSMKDYEDRFVEDTVRLCRIPSVKGEAEEGAPYGKKTVEALELFLQRGQELGFRTRNLDNRAGYLEMGEGDEMVACLCHLDVVPAGDGWQSDPFEPRVEKGRIIARGSSDDKGPAVMALYALKSLMDDPDFKTRRRLRLIVGLDEENGSSCMAHYAASEEIPVSGFTPDASFPAIYAEKGIVRLEFSMPRGSAPLSRAQGGEAVNMVPGRAAFTLQLPAEEQAFTVTGRPAHASTPALGENAVQMGMKQVKEKLDAVGVNDPFVDFFHTCFGQELDGQALGFAYEDESGKTTVNVGLLHVDDDFARLAVDIRYPVTMDLAGRLAALKERLSGLTIDVQVSQGMEPLNLGKDSFLIQTLMDAYNRGSGEDGQAIAIGGGTYARSVPNIAAFGPAFPDDEHVAHQVDEYIVIERALAAMSIYRDALKTLATAD